MIGISKYFTLEEKSSQILEIYNKQNRADEEVES
jgi:hypothetical protein